MTSLCSSSYFRLCKKASIRPYLSDQSTAQLVSSLIFSGFDYCNSTLSGLPSSSLNRLQKVQKQCCQTCPPQTKIRPRYSPSGKPTLASCRGPYPLQNCHINFHINFQLSSSVPFRTASHLPTLSNSSVQQRKT